MDKILEKLKHEYITEDERYAYADSIANAFLTSQIKALQEQRGLTQEELATLVGTQQSGISRWLNSGFSTCKVDTLRKFARAYGVRLRITFEEFGSLPEDVRGFTKRRLSPNKFEDDPAFKDQAEGQIPHRARKTANMQMVGRIPREKRSGSGNVGAIDVGHLSKANRNELQMRTSQPRHDAGMASSDTGNTERLEKVG